jgi:hypothetical protein
LVSALPSYTLDAPSLDAAEGDLLRLWRDNLSVRGDVARKLAWTCKEAPTPPLAELLVRSGDEAVGCIGVMRRNFRVAGDNYAAGLIGDLAVDAAHRTLMPALTLVRGARKLALEHGPLTYGFPNPAASPVLQRCGYKTLGSLTRYARVLRHARYVRRRISTPLVVTAASPILDGFRFAGMLAPAARALPQVKLDWLKATDARFDALWESARSSYDIVAERTAAFLTWRFLRHPEEQCEIAALVDRRGAGELFAYAVVQHDGETARIRDIFGAPDHVGPLLDLLLPTLVLRGAESASIRYFGGAGLTALLQARGFAARESSWRIVYDVAPGGPLTRETVADTTRWYLTDADEDI